MEQPVGEYMPPVGVGTDLRLVQCDERHLAVARHRFGSAQEIARAVGNDLFLAGNQRDLRGTLDRDDAVIDFACQQAQRKADHAADVAAHALDREVRLAGVGRAKNRGQPRVLVGAKQPAHDPWSGSVLPGETWGKPLDGARLIASFNNRVRYMWYATLNTAIQVTVVRRRFAASSNSDRRSGVDTGCALPS